MIRRNYQFQKYTGQTFNFSFLSRLSWEMASRFLRFPGLGRPVALVRDVDLPRPPLPLPRPRPCWICDGRGSSSSDSWCLRLVWVVAPLPRPREDPASEEEESSGRIAWGAFPLFRIRPCDNATLWKFLFMAAMRLKYWCFASNLMHQKFRRGPNSYISRW